MTKSHRQTKKRSHSYHAQVGVAQAPQQLLHPGPQRHRRRLPGGGGIEEEGGIQHESYRPPRGHGLGEGDANCQRLGSVSGFLLGVGTSALGGCRAGAGRLNLEPGMGKGKLLIGGPRCQWQAWPPTDAWVAPGGRKANRCAAQQVRIQESEYTCYYSFSLAAK